MTFPNEIEPDGDRFLPHHYLHGAWGVGLLAVVHEATWVLAFITLSLFGWYHVWYHYHVFGAALTLTALCGSLVASLLSPALDPTATTLAAVAFLWALDDAVEHATGIWTPLDWLWNTHLRKHIYGLRG